MTLSLIPENEPPVGLVNATRLISYLIIAALFFQYRALLFTKDQRERYDGWLIRNWKHFFTAHSLTVYPFFYFFGGLGYGCDTHTAAAAWIEILLNVMSIPLALLLWDGAIIYGTQFETMLLAGLHHIGVFIVLPYHIHENPLIASRTTKLFGWLWLTHGFRFIQNTLLLPLFVVSGGMISKGEENIPALDRMRELYSLITVSLLSSYFSAESQPGFGWNYQTVSILPLLIGRYLFNRNFNRISYFRRVEIPGSISIFISAVSSCKVYWGIIITICLYTIRHFYYYNGSYTTSTQRKEQK
jgi:hypothetical protein